jgi:protein TonB
MHSWSARPSCARPTLALNYNDYLDDMDTTIRTRAVCVIVLASLCGCGTIQSVTSSAQRITARVLHPFRPAPTGQPAPASPALDAYKTEVAQHVVRRNAAHTFSGKLPPMLPAIVVLNITVDKDGHLTNVAVQRSRDSDASRVAVASIERSGTLPRLPASLLHGNGDSLTFSETFLFNSDYRFQLRSLAEAQECGRSCAGWKP